MMLARSASLYVVLAILAVQPGAAQDHGNAAMPSHTLAAPSTFTSPYAGMQKRGIKALSDQEIANLKAGRGMGLALVAELNGYPGPLHVLEFADALELSEQQQASTRALLEAMKAETILLGERIIVEEAELDRLFAEKRVIRASLDAAISMLASVRGELRAAHLRYHLAMVEFLSPAQIARYVALRGYFAGGHDDHRNH